ncbi:hypothetical protein [Burkholderia cenocepacia]|uniref:hypothetical protein n=1 Tax=Burkholderia cenocepacia TaxID=95486 RepID=UPI001CF570A5|nr:hypothetical protein [Burkholderia cenocepacia]MCA8232735.1 hypothetical protein [Burkholderia cenocepacia]
MSTTKPSAHPDPATPPNAGDEGPAGAPGISEDTCRVCRGTGRVEGQPCTVCGGTGKILQGIGGG